MNHQCTVMNHLKKHTYTVSDSEHSARCSQWARCSYTNRNTWFQVSVTHDDWSASAKQSCEMMQIPSGSSPCATQVMGQLQSLSTNPQRPAILLLGYSQPVRCHWNTFYIFQYECCSLQCHSIISPVNRGPKSWHNRLQDLTGSRHFLQNTGLL
jgi:hypothetical protein